MKSIGIHRPSIPRRLFSELSRLESWGAAVYFAHPYRSGERGQNERHNGLFRRFLPKGTALDPYTAEALFWIADEINRLPRRILDYRTPDELFESELDNVYKIQHANSRLPTVQCALAIEGHAIIQLPECYSEALLFYRRRNMLYGTAVRPPRLHPFSSRRRRFSSRRPSSRSQASRSTRREM